MRKQKAVFLSLITIFVASGLTACSETQNVSETATADDLDHAEVVKSDLFAVITLQGSRCGKVVGYEQQSNLDYVAVCDSGDRYRVHVSPEGRVNVNPHTSD